MIQRYFYTLLLIFSLASCSQGNSDHDWPVHGLNHRADRFSPLQQINTETVQQLGLAWFFDLQTDRGQEATPIMQDGVLYFSSAYNVVYAIDARNGHLIWRYDPQVMAASARSCCGPVSRGVAVSKDRVLVAALDGRVISLDKKTGRVQWQVQTIDPANPLAENYSITGAPRIVKDMVLIGNGGAEFGSRGYVTAYAIADGAKRWRFYTVPGQPGRPDNEASDDILAKVSNTWAGEYWKYGGGGTAWDTIEFDPELNIVFIGTGNGSPWNHQMRSAGVGDNLFLSSIVAVDADSGEYRWHFQTTPADAWDYTATQNMIMTDLEIEGKTRKVLLQAPKNGFFYVLDRVTGEFISGENFVNVSWADGLDVSTGRPLEKPSARYYRTGQPTFQFPSSGGGHNWPPMAYSPNTGLVYIPAQDVGMPFGAAKEEQVIGAYTTGVAMHAGRAMDEASKKALYDGMRGYLIAWDPKTHQEAWRVEQKAPFNGGVLATAGGLVIAGNTAREIVVYNAQSGGKLWSFDAQTGVLAPPITYSLDGKQYIAVLAGWGGGWPLTGGVMALQAGNSIGPNRLLVFSLDGAKSLPSFTPEISRDVAIVSTHPASALANEGAPLYARYCLRCHGTGVVSAGSYPDLRRSSIVMSEAFDHIVRGGALVDKGMPSYKDKLNENQLKALQAFIALRSYEDFGTNPSTPENNQEN